MRPASKGSFLTQDMNQGGHCRWRGQHIQGAGLTSKMCLRDDRETTLVKVPPRQLGRSYMECSLITESF